MLPNDMRGELKKPLGRLLRGEVSDNVVALRRIIEEKKPPCFATVGDYVTFYVIGSGLDPDLAVVDHRVMRQDVDPFNFRRKSVAVSNPAGTIKAEAQRVLWDAITLKKRLGVVVEGEEDLLVLPLMAMMPIGSVIVYGQPREGMVVVTLTEERRRWAKDFMAEMEEDS